MSAQGLGGSSLSIKKKGKAGPQREGMLEDADDVGTSGYRGDRFVVLHTVYLEATKKVSEGRKVPQSVAAEYVQHKVQLSFPASR